MIHWMLAVWSLVPMPFVNPAWTSVKFSGSHTSEAYLEGVEQYLASMWNECNCVVVWTFFGIVFLWDWNKTDLYQSCGHCWVFQICWLIEYSTVTVSSLRIWNSLAGIPPPQLALFVVMLPKAHLTSHSKIFGSRWVITPITIKVIIILSFTNHNFLRNIKWNVETITKQPGVII